WNLRMTPPKVAEGGVKLDMGAFAAPMVLPGDYTVKLTVGDKTYTQPLKVVHDERGEMTVAERKQQYEAAMQLYAMQEDLARVVDTINKAQKLLKENMEKLQNKKSRQLAEDYYNKLEEQRGKLLATKNKSVFADEKRLKEEISEVYSAVAGNEAAPSNLQVQRIELLKTELQKQDQQTRTLMEQYNGKVMQAFQKENINLAPKGKVSMAGTSG
ncbi:MAG: hypothetical protein MUF29_10295, partial [Chitinophagaceae bacterium]|nr:hypothetical protein [Chitinophagaceae bacterium]